MALEIIITSIDDTDYDGVAVSIKQVSCKIGGIVINEHYSYPSTIADATIDAEVEADLTVKGYTW